MPQFAARPRPVEGRPGRLKFDESKQSLAREVPLALVWGPLGRPKGAVIVRLGQLTSLVGIASAGAWVGVWGS